jgi:hypothetical protein
MFRHKISKPSFEFYYLTQLTRQKIKPLSRWEKPLSRRQFQWLKKNGLQVDTILRKTIKGDKINETVFSLSSHYLNFYRRHFQASVLNKSLQTQTLEGFLFGYPSCCVKNFVEKPYVNNELPANEQEKLFHWTCPGCRSTPQLLPYYRKVYDDTLEWYQKEFNSVKSDQFSSIGKLSWAAALTLFLSSTSLPAQVIPDSSHYIPVPQDLDQDYLSDAEEVYVGSNFFYAYTLPGITDNLYWTGYFKAIIDALPTTPQTNQPYREDFNMNGLETCQKCGAQVNMGYVRIINPMRQMQTDIPYLGLHFLDYHCFSYEGNTQSGRVNLDSLKKILFPYQSAHMFPVVGDSDQDGLTDAEEDSLYFDPNNSDTNGDSLPDGAEVAEQLIRLIPKLKEQNDQIHSHFIYQPVFGIENCTICGATHNMGYIEFHNPENGKTYQIHFNGLHTLAHGSFAYDGTTWPNQRADAVDIYRTMKTHSLHIQNDSDQDGLTDEEEIHFGFDPNVMDSDGNGICDGMDLAIQMNTVLESLPTQYVPNGPYVIHHYTFGHWNCLLCGEDVNMGFMELFNSAVSTNPIIISYYAHHFLKKGSFAYEGRIENGQWLEGRLDPIMLAQYLEIMVNQTPPNSQIVGQTFVLEQNYPNPFNPSTAIEFELLKRSDVTLKIFNILGDEVATLVSDKLSAGSYSYEWDASNFASGVYFYRLQAGDDVETRKMVLMR